MLEKNLRKHSIDLHSAQLHSAQPLLSQPLKYVIETIEALAFFLDARESQHATRWTKKRFSPSEALHTFDATYYPPIGHVSAVNIHRIAAARPILRNWRCARQFCNFFALARAFVCLTSILSLSLTVSREACGWRKCICTSWADRRSISINIFFFPQAMTSTKGGVYKFYRHRRCASLIKRREKKKNHSREVSRRCYNQVLVQCEIHD